METGKLKNFILLLLLLLNLALGALLLSDRLEQIHSRRAAEASFLLLLEQRGLTPGAALTLPTETLQAWSLTRDPAMELRLVERLLGKTSREDRGGNIYFYESDQGTASFRGTGEFEFVLDPGRVCSGDMTHFLQTLLADLNLEAAAAAVTVQDEVTGPVAEAICAWQSGWVWNCRVRFFFQGDTLWRISGQRLFDIAGSEQGQCLQAATAVLRFLDSAYGQQAAVLESVAPGYTMRVPLSGSCTLQPVWLLETDAGRFQVNAVTGHTEPLAE